MIRDAEAHAEEDKRRLEEAEARNNAENLVYQVEKLLREQGEKITPEDRGNVEANLDDLKSALKGSDVADIRTKTELLMNASQEFTQKLYEAAAAAENEYAAGGGGSGAAGPDLSKDDEVVDAEIVDDEGSN